MQFAVMADYSSISIIITNDSLMVRILCIVIEILKETKYIQLMSEKRDLVCKLI